MSDVMHFLTRDLDDVPADDKWLSRAEREVLAGLKFPKRRGDWRLGRWTSKLLLLDYLNLSAADLSNIEIIAATDGAHAGAPAAFLHGKPANVSISISHAGGRGFCCAAAVDVALGCDIEQLEPRGEAMVSDFFTSEEIARIRSVAPENQILMTNLIWSAKESVLKALREGLRRDTRSVAIEAVSCEKKNGWRRFQGRCLQSARVFHGRWLATDHFVHTCASETMLAMSGGVSQQGNRKQGSAPCLYVI